MSTATILRSQCRVGGLGGTKEDQGKGDEGTSRKFSVLSFLLVALNRKVQTSKKDSSDSSQLSQLLVFKNPSFIQFHSDFTFLWPV